jgi:hypothetical protein
MKICGIFDGKSENFSSAVKKCAVLEALAI